MKSGKLVLAGIASVMLVSAAAIPALAQQANGDNKTLAPGPRGPMAFVMQMLDTNTDGKITRDEFDADKAKIFAEIDKNGDKKLSYDEVKAWARDVMAKMPEGGPGMGPKGGPDAPPPPADGKAPPPPPPGADNGPEKADGGPMHGPDAMDGPRGEWRHGPKGPHGMGHMGHHMGPRHMDPRERLAEMFMRADANDDGFISQEEFNVMADRMFTRMDRNGDGVLDMKDMPRMHGMRDGGPGKPPKKG